MSTFINIEQELILNLHEGKILLHATDTIYGLCSSMKSEKGRSKIYKIKERSANKPIILLVNSIVMLKNYVKSIHPRVETLLEIHKRPLTIIYSNPKNLPDFTLAPDGSIAIRVVDDIQTKEIITRLGCPILSSSANVEGEAFPKSEDDISKVIINSVDMRLIASPEQLEIMTGEPSVLARYHLKSGELDFLRE